MCIQKPNGYWTDDTILSELKQVIHIQDCPAWFDISVILNTQEEAKLLLSKIPKSYRMRIQKLYSGDNIYYLVTAHIVLKPTELTGAVNETGRSRIIKIRKRLQELIPNFKVTRQILIPSHDKNHSNCYVYSDTIEGW